MAEGRVPKDWRQANITALYKKGDKKQPSNYRPVSLTSIICKVMEQFIREAIMDHMMINNLICKEQHGFVKGKNCITNLLETIDDWTKSMEIGNSVDAVYLDFKKAFDKVPHKRLVMKLKMYGIDDKIVNWVADFLRDRTQRVMVNGEASSWKKVTSGIPQGSVLGPSLFVIYINDLPESIQSKYRIFADDTKVYSEGEGGGNVKLQRDIDALQEWSDRWQIQFNVDKCAVMHLGKNNLKKDYSMSINNETQSLVKSEAEKDLGVVVDDNLKFSKHIEGITQKANQILGVLRRNFKNINRKTFVMLYKVLVKSKLEYGNVIWNPTNERDRDMLERVPRRATKIVQGLKHKGYSERLASLKLPTLEFRRLRGDLLQTHKIIHKKDNMNDIFYFNNKNRTRGHTWKMAKQRCSLKQRRHFFSNRVINSWNSLPDEAVVTKQLNTVKRHIDKCEVFGDKFVYKSW